jgi:phosphatidylserine/phosphatidylglycerophosphate/cardiolipin synthase-like enzyme
MNEPIAIFGKNFPVVVIPLIDSAKHSIDIIVFDWRIYPDESAGSVREFNLSIKNAVERGVDVRVLVNNSAVGETLKKWGCKVKKLYSPKLMHAKLMIIDRRIIICGSHNYTQSAFSMNEEVSCAFSMSDDYNDFVQYFNRLYGF